ncbi:MAG TPA: PEGA domain-containing protein [Patescibacteria group bacterium]|nr:PEGA domain-containing protein [Patescibacteria group bacterium]
MTLHRRRWLYLSFIVIFVIVGSALLFYLQGYRLSLTNWQVERTGAIQANSEPKNARVSLNGQIADELTPATLLSLRPADYDVELTLAGFQTWHKTLTVSPAEVTFTGNVTLWPELNTGTPLGVTNLSNSFLSPNGENLLYLTKPNAGTELWLLNLTSGQVRLLTRNAAAEIIAAEWQSSSRELLTQERLGKTLIWRVFSLETNSWKEVTLPPELSVNAIHWGEERGLLYATTTNELYELDQRTQATKLIWRERLKDWRVHDGLIFGLTSHNGEAISLKLLNLSNLQTVPLTETPTLSTDVTFMPARQDWLPLFDADRHSLYLLHSPLSDLKPIRLLPEVTTMSWASNDSLVITNNFEIWQYNLADESPIFVERLSSTLAGAQRYGAEPYILFFGGNEIWATELDDRGERQRWLLAQFSSNVTSLFLSPEAATLTVQTADDIYRLNLRATAQTSSPPTDLPSTMIQKFLHLSNRP